MFLLTHNWSFWRQAISVAYWYWQPTSQQTRENAHENWPTDKLTLITYSTAVTTLSDTAHTYFDYSGPCGGVAA